MGIFGMTRLLKGGKTQADRIKKPYSERGSRFWQAMKMSVPAVSLAAMIAAVSIDSYNLDREVEKMRTEVSQLEEILGLIDDYLPGSGTIEDRLSQSGTVVSWNADDFPGFTLDETIRFIKSGGTKDFARAYLNHGITPQNILRAKAIGLEEGDAKKMQKAQDAYHWDSVYECFYWEDLRSVLEKSLLDPRPKGLIIFPHDLGDEGDQKNYAFRAMSAKLFFSSFISRYDTSIYEVSDEHEYVSAVKSMGRGRIFRMIDAGHGSRTSTTYVRGGEYGRLDLSDEKEMLREDLGSYFASGAVLFAFSCENGSIEDKEKTREALKDEGCMFAHIVYDKGIQNLARMRSRIFKDVMIISSRSSFTADEIDYDWERQVYPVIVKDKQNTSYYMNDMFFGPF